MSFQGEERLQKIINRVGIASRRGAEALIREGRVRVNGHVITKLGSRADAAKDQIVVNGRPLPRVAMMSYIALHKPVGIVTTLSDPEGRPTVRDLLRGIRSRLYPVGRLDYHSSGLLLFTNDGELAFRLTHPRYGVTKTYRVKVRGVPDEAAIARLSSGVRLEEATTAEAGVRVLRSEGGKAWLEMTLHEGRRREIRRMCERVGHPVLKLSRIRFGPISLGKIPVGEYRELTEAEVAKLRSEVGI